MKHGNCYLRVRIAGMVLAAVCLAMSAGMSAQTCNGLSSPNLVVNGNFESGSLYSITGWSVAWDSSADRFMYLYTSNQHSGNQALWMGAVPGSNRIYQQIPNLVPGAVYTVCFWLANDVKCCASSFQATWNDNNILDMTNNAGFGYQYFTFQVVAVGKGRDVLSFQARQVPSYYYLDDVALQVCPSCTLTFSSQEKTSSPVIGDN